MTICDECGSLTLKRNSGVQQVTCRKAQDVEMSRGGLPTRESRKMEMEEEQGEVIILVLFC